MAVHPPGTPGSWSHPGSQSISRDQQEQEESGEKEQELRSPTCHPSECKKQASGHTLVKGQSSRAQLFLVIILEWKMSFSLMS